MFALLGGLPHPPHNKNKNLPYSARYGRDRCCVVSPPWGSPHVPNGAGVLHMYPLQQRNRNPYLSFRRFSIACRPSLASRPGSNNGAERT